jgi:hypoxanthine phosphoribosyltransferase
MQNNQIHIFDKIFNILISEDEIKLKVDELAARINNDYNDKSPVFIVVLKGAIFFAVDLLKKINLNIEIRTISAKSYGNSMTSTGEVLINSHNLYIENRDVIIIEDIIDTGLTLDTLISNIKKFNPASIECAVFLSKPEQRKIEVPVKYLGIEIPSDFVVGYGLDFAEYGRNFPAIYSQVHK